MIFPMSIGRTPTRRNATARKVLRKTTPSVESLRTKIVVVRNKATGEITRWRVEPETVFNAYEED